MVDVIKSPVKNNIVGLLNPTYGSTIVVCDDIKTHNKLISINNFYGISFNDLLNILYRVLGTTNLISKNNIGYSSIYTNYSETNRCYCFNFIKNDTLIKVECSCVPLMNNKLNIVNIKIKENDLKKDFDNNKIKTILDVFKNNTFSGVIDVNIKKSGKIKITFAKKKYMKPLKNKYNGNYNFITKTLVIDTNNIIDETFTEMHHNYIRTDIENLLLSEMVEEDMYMILDEDCIDDIIPVNTVGLFDDNTFASDNDIENLLDNKELF